MVVSSTSGHASVAMPLLHSMLLQAACGEWGFLLQVARAGLLPAMRAAGIALATAVLAQWRLWRSCWAAHGHVRLLLLQTAAVLF